VKLGVRVDFWRWCAACASCGSRRARTIARLRLVTLLPNVPAAAQTVSLRVP
jgi:hypothetical protein